MLTEERYTAILRLLETRGAATVQELTEALHSSESTIRRDLNVLSRQGRLHKVHGGATALRVEYRAKEYPAFARAQIDEAEKERIAQRAAAFISDYDLVFLDTGTTTGCMANYITAQNITIVTNGLLLAKRLAERGFAVLVTGGQAKPTTEALVGGTAVSNLQRYNFTIGFFGANGISIEHGCTTPDADEAIVKTTAMAHCRRCFLLADSAKFGVVSSVTFAPIGQATILTGEHCEMQYRQQASIIEVLA